MIILANAKPLFVMPCNNFLIIRGMDWELFRMGYAEYERSPERTY